MNKRKRIAMVSLDHYASRFLTEQLRDVFEDEVEVIPILLEDSNKIDLEDIDIIVCSSKVIVEQIEGKINKNIPIIPVRRSINLNKLSEVLSIDTGEKVLLVSNHLSAAEETIYLLKKIGIEHIDFIPYYPGANVEPLDIAVTTGGNHLVPDGVRNVIDIGIRVIDISSIIEIFFKLNLPTEDLHLISAKYSKEMIRLTKYNGETNKILKAMFEVTNDGIAALDVSGNIFFCNHKFADYLGYKHSQIISRNIVEVIRDRGIIDSILDSNQRNNEIVEIKGKQLMMNKALLYQGSILKGHVIGLQEVAHIQNLEKEVRKKLVNKGFISKYTFNDLKGTSRKLTDKVNIAKKIAKSDLTVLIQGEDGTGKEIFAQAIHNASMRKNGPFVAVNFAAISESLLESELFGYEEGSFTGANKGGKAGLFEQADKGTIFIDEIGDTTLNIQKRLLRVLQEKQVMRVGGTKIIPIDVRVIAATNKDLLELVDNQRFRKDLYYRLKVLHFNLPKLNERKEDIPLLVEFFLNNLGSSKYLSNEVVRLFKTYSWPGNIRELENLMYYLNSIVEQDEIRVDDLPEEFIAQVEGMKHVEDNTINHIEIDLLPIEKINEYIAILKILNSSNELGVKLGRNKISKTLIDNNIDLSPEQVRARMKELERAEMVQIGNTKQGTTISSKGKELLLSYER